MRAKKLKSEPSVHIDAPPVSWDTGQTPDDAARLPPHSAARPRVALLPEK
ncbi:hypothetical protein [Termitidicoccus mucosus]